MKQGFLTVDAYYKETELLMQRSQVQESIQMTMQWFLHGLRLPIKNIVQHHTYNDMNQLLHHAMEAEAQLAEEAQQKSRFHLLVDTLPGRLLALPQRHLGDSYSPLLVH
jgi:hypothetical protein